MKAAEKLGLESVPVIKADDLTDEQIRAFRLADNKTAELAGWDFAELERELEELKDIDMSRFGFEEMNKSNLEDLFGEAEEKADIYIFEAIRKRTQGRHLWLRNNVSTILCNCLENFFFVGFAFLGVFSFKDILLTALSVSLIEAIVGICDTPFLYIARKIKDK